MNVCGHPGASYRWVDEANARVTQTSDQHPLCRDCYTYKHGTPRDFLRPVEADLYRMSDGILGVHHVLSSGDHPNRNQMRARFRVISSPSNARTADKEAN